MKIRGGFVSNSSSSSFIVMFKKTPQSAEELRVALFGGNENVIYPEDSRMLVGGGLEFYPSAVVAEIIFEDMQEIGPASDDELLAELENYVWHHLYYPLDLDRDEHIKDCSRQFASMLLDQIRYRMEGRPIFLLEYGNEPDVRGGRGRVPDHIMEYAVFVPYNCYTPFYKIENR